ncbi:MAG: 1-acyl-sn-glycerol-3-phosphate acyltransferase [Firmicutes bacterium]|nr:1-acyl-sn-glycerol-3-phosphate acyltransferase [Bacillota bacterium]
MNRVYRLIYAIAWPFFNLFHPCRVIGRERIPEGGALLCPNHTRNADPLLVVFAMGQGRGPQIMAKEELRKVPLVGYVLHKMGLIFVKRGASDISAIRSALKTLKEGRKLLIFPEGTRHEETGEGKTGAAMIAIRAGVPILPMYIPAKKLWFRRTPVVFGEPFIPFTEDRKPTVEDYRAATVELMARINSLEEQAK